ncbi:hypothetical protein FNF31_00485 [Cafeteria roenbergensis]|uniref:Uncharacterized protein n=1 Tax=Cafeteria roenbergensis TaxID=33653 RepID=A0A5A8DT06_CAFRO|nr:hypothetical protein FNF31_00485 [Cafeteria roenbergensis]
MQDVTAASVAPPGEMGTQRWPGGGDETSLDADGESPSRRLNWEAIASLRGLQLEVLLRYHDMAETLIAEKALKPRERITAIVAHVPDHIVRPFALHTLARAVGLLSRLRTYYESLSKAISNAEEQVAESAGLSGAAALGHASAIGGTGRTRSGSDASRPSRAASAPAAPAADHAAAISARDRVRRHALRAATDLGAGELALQLWRTARVIAIFVSGCSNVREAVDAERVMPLRRFLVSSLAKLGKVRHDIIASSGPLLTQGIQQLMSVASTFDGNDAGVLDELADTLAAALDEAARNAAVSEPTPSAPAEAGDAAEAPAAAPPAPDSVSEGAASHPPVPSAQVGQPRLTHEHAGERGTGGAPDLRRMQSADGESDVHSFRDSDAAGYDAAAQAESEAARASRARELMELRRRFASSRYCAEPRAHIQQRDQERAAWEHGIGGLLEDFA